MPTIVGIDLGTTNSVVAARNAYGRPEVIANREGRNVTPSVVYFGGRPAGGRPGGQGVGPARQRGDRQLLQAPHGEPQFTLQFHGRDYDATDLSAFVLSRLKDDAEASSRSPSTGPSSPSPPTSPTPSARPRSRPAGARGSTSRGSSTSRRPRRSPTGLQKTGIEETVLIYDLGGGTFDVTVARITPERSPSSRRPATTTSAARTGTTGSPPTSPRSSPPRPASTRSTTRWRSTRCCCSASRRSGRSRSARPRGSRSSSARARSRTS